jgi:hyperosmotically inducible protein
MKVLLPVMLCVVFLGCRTNETPEAQVNDFEIQASVKSKLASDVGLSTVPNISVNSTNGVVTLSGMVSSADQKSKAEAVAKSVPHVTRVVNNLQVASTNSSRVRSAGGERGSRCLALPARSAA